MNSEVMHESERAGGMGAPPRRRLRRAKHVDLGVRWFTFHERFNCQVTARKRIARGDISRILRIPNSWTSNDMKTIQWHPDSAHPPLLSFILRAPPMPWDVNHLTPRPRCLGSSESSPGRCSHATCISNWAFQFPEVSQPGQPLKTAENRKTWRLGNLCLFFRKPHGGIRCENLQNLQKPVEPWKVLLWYIYNTIYVSSIYMYINKKSCLMCTYIPCGCTQTMWSCLCSSGTTPMTTNNAENNPTTTTSTINGHPPPLEASLDYNVAHPLHWHS